MQTALERCVEYWEKEKGKKLPKNVTVQELAELQRLHSSDARGQALLIEVVIEAIPSLSKGK